MSVNTNLQQQRFLEVASVSAAEQTIHILHDMVCSPTTKRFQKEREARIERWTQLATDANAMVALLKQAVPAKRVVKPKAVTLPTPIVPEGSTALPQSA